MLFDVSLPPITILHLSAPGARLVLIDIDWDRDRMQRIIFPIRSLHAFGNVALLPVWLTTNVECIGINVS